MTDVTFVTSLQGRQAERVKDISSGLMEKRPELKVEVFEAEQHGDLLAKFKLKYGPCVMIDGKLQFVGIPSLRQLVEKIDSLAKAAAAKTPEPSTAQTK
jgi:hypothetical protein